MKRKRQKECNKPMTNKNKKLIPLFVGGLTLSLLFGGYLLGSHLKNVKNARAYSTSSLPTTIDLNDNSDSEIRSYYSSLNSLATSERSGTNLLKNLKPILKNGQKYLSYDSTTSIWDVYCIVDRDWEHSPITSLPSAAGTYNANTNMITNYKWGGNSSKYENPYLHALYYNRDQASIAVAYGDHQNSTSTGINREHIWPKGAGFDQEGSGGARGDIMHLWAANGHTNNVHSNNFYGYVDTTKSYTDIGDTSTYSMCAGNLSGKSKTFTSSSNTVFEPQDSDKGDIARACFYMVARYNYLSGSDSDGIDSNNPNLELVNNVTDFQGSGYTSSTSNTGKLGILQDLLEWNRLDPPDEFEIHRNNLCYNNFTNNRNPFIDFPEWAEYIWGKSTDGSYDSSSTGYATPSSDSINDFGGGGDTPTPTVSSVSVSPSSLELDLNGTKTGNLSATVNGTNNPSQTVTWISLDSSIATVSSSGVVTAKAVGTTTIKATSTIDTTKYGTCSVTVSDSGQGGGGEQGDNVTVSTSIASYANANSWTNGTKYTSVILDDVVTASVANGSSNTGKYYTSGNEWRFYQTENGSISISIAEGYVLDSVTFTYSVANNGVLLDSSSNTVSSGVATSVSGSSATFSVGNTGTATNGQVKFTNISVTYHSTSEPTPTVSYVTITPSSLELDLNGSTSGNLSATVTGTNSPAQTVTWESNNADVVTVDDNGVVTAIVVGTATITATSTIDPTKSGLCTVTVVDTTPLTLSSIEIDGFTSSLEAGTEFVFGGTVTAIYSDSSQSDVTSLATFSGYNMSIEGVYTVTVSYTYEGITRSTSYTLTVTAPSGEEIVVTNHNFKEVTSVTELVDGCNIALVGYYEKSGTYYASQVCSSSATYLATSVVQVVDDVLTGTFETYNLGISIYDKYTFKDSNNKYLTAKSSSSNQLGVDNSVTDNSTWNISLSDSKFDIISTGSFTRNNMRFNYNSGSPRFSCYASTSSITSRPIIFIDTSEIVADFIDNYLYMSTYTSNLGYCKDNTHHYYQTAKDYLLDMGDKYIDEFKDNDDFNAAQARYETWAAINGDSTPYAFNENGSAKLVDVEATNTVVAVVVIVSLLSLSTSTLYISFRRRKLYK